MNSLNSLFLAAVFALSVLYAPSSHATEPCLKQVFNRYCLGGAPPDGLLADKDNRIHIESPQGKVTLQLHGNRISSVSRELTPANWLRFTDIKVQLVRLYSTATDISDFPRYATSRSSKLNAIRSGRGFAAARWEPADWAVVLEWRTLGNMQLRYEHLVSTALPAPTDNLEGL